MKPPVEFQDRGAYRARMNELLRIDPARTVVLTVDMQRDYLDPEVASAPVALDEAERVMKHARDLLDFARGRGLPVVHVYVNRRRTEAERGLETAGETFRVGREAGLSQNAQRGVRTIPDRREGSPQAEVPAILVAPDDVHVTSQPSSCPTTSSLKSPARPGMYLSARSTDSSPGLTAHRSLAGAPALPPSGGGVASSVAPFP